LLVLQIPAHGEGEGRKSVLILNPFNREAEPFGGGAATFRQTLARDPRVNVDFYDVSLDLVDFPTGEGEDGLLAFLEERIRKSSIDLVVPIGAVAARFAYRHRDDLFKDLPILALGPEPRMLPDDFLDRRTTMVGAPVDVPALMDDLLQVLPETRRVAVVFGASQLEKAWADVFRREFARYAGRVEFDWLVGLPVPRLLEEVRRLPPGTPVLHALFLVDPDGFVNERNEVLQRLCETSPGPVRSIFFGDFGSGTLGGRLVDNLSLGRVAADFAARILSGESAGSIPPHALAPLPPVFDWRELHRWNIPESSLPDGARIEFRPPSPWDLYRWQIIVGTLFCLLQSGMIAGLMISRARIRRAENQAMLMAQISESFINLPPGQIDEEIIGAQREICGLLKLDVATLWQWSGEANDLLLTHVHGEVAAPLPERMEATAYFPAFLQEMLAGREASFTSLADLPAAAARDRESFQTFGVLSNFTLPLAVGGEKPLGAISFNTTSKPHKWQPGETAFLRIIARIFANALARKRTDRALRESELRVSLATEAAGAGLWILDWKKQVFWANARAREMFDFAENQKIDMETFFGLLDPVGRETVDSALRRAVEEQADIDVEYQILLPDGKSRWIASKGRPLFDPAGQIERVIGLSIDITTRRTAEIEAAELRRELAHSGRVTLLGQLASSLAHELSQPLGAILCNAEAASIMLGQPLPDIEELREILQDVIRDDRRAGQVIHKLRSLLKKGTLDFQPLPIVEVIEEVMVLVAPDAAARHVALEFDAEPDLPNISGDRTHLQQVLLNLVVNAMDALNGHTNGERRVKIRARAGDPGWIVVDVHDNGPGIPEESLGSIFEPFFTTKESGMGMGLAISKNMVEAHGGQIHAENHPDGGARFSFTLPVHAP
jgi:PAS domain S-box-containing protein